MTPRGIRNNNPGNIRKSSTIWRGMMAKQDDPDFVRFTTAAWGVRALMRTLMTYQSKHKLMNVHGIISRWAPPNENNTGAYIASVAKRLEVEEYDHISLGVPENLIRMAQAIVRHENGLCQDLKLPWWYPEEIYEEAAAIALGRPVDVIS